MRPLRHSNPEITSTRIRWTIRGPSCRCLHPRPFRGRTPLDNRGSMFSFIRSPDPPSSRPAACPGYSQVNLDPAIARPCRGPVLPTFSDLFGRNCSEARVLRQRKNAKEEGASIQTGQWYSCNRKPTKSTFNRHFAVYAQLYNPCKSKIQAKNTNRRRPSRGTVQARQPGNRAVSDSRGIRELRRYPVFRHRRREAASRIRCRSPSVSSSSVLYRETWASLNS